MILYLFCSLEVREIVPGIHDALGLVEEEVTDINEAWKVLQTGSKARFVASTNVNEVISQSHWFPKIVCSLM